MASNTSKGLPVARGRWVYDGAVEVVIEIAAFERAPLERMSDLEGHPLVHPLPAGSGRLVYFLRQDGDLLGPGFADVRSAKAWAQDQSWAPVNWDD